MNTASTAFRLLVMLCILALVLLSVLSFAFISPRRTLHASPINLNAPSLKPTDHSYLAACVPMDKDLTTLPEFLLHHHAHIGIQKFYLVDQSTAGDVSRNYGELPLNSTYVTWLRAQPSTENETAQFSAYDACQSRYGSHHAWIAYLDVDEFIEQRQKDTTLQDFLHTMDKNSTIGALGINVLLHTSNNLTQKSEFGFRKSFTECVSSDVEKSPNEHIKSIVKTKYYEKPRTDHNFITKSKSITVGETGDRVPFIFRRPITTNLFAIHHYALRSEEEFKLRIENGEVEEPRTYPDMMEWSEVIHRMPKMKCDSMAQLNP
ncbi:hypothetical protein DRE_01104 [Drechslerella stenobrocha 248]|uniref:Glycosyltransferase family 92 protein n=1 Tax=Drechslerella stenobrocha 248 TaxID=1043628 RepID=W7HWH7_9PEZI|nr:hypothetical protein DRE_01104 [Drechslerella stenobrocha 248]